MADGYYMNSLRAWKGQLQRDHRRMMARYASLESQLHPSRIGQGKLIKLNARMIELVDEALAAEEPKS